MNYLELKKQWLIEEKLGFQGWDFSCLEGRVCNEQLPWDYKVWITRFLKPEYQLLDMGTGGGEFLLNLNHPYENTSVTEGWEPNLQLCHEKLAPLGIEVSGVTNHSELPFKDNSFDIIINRHEEYVTKEVRRILKPGGMFVTQQVGGENNRCLSKILISEFKPQSPNFNVREESIRIAEEGFSIIYKNEYFPRAKYFDIGAVVYLAKIIEWEFPDFTVKKT